MTDKDVIESNMRFAKAAKTDYADVKNNQLYNFLAFAEQSKSIYTPDQLRNDWNIVFGERLINSGLFELTKMLCANGLITAESAYAGYIEQETEISDDKGISLVPSSAAYEALDRLPLSFTADQPVYAEQNIKGACESVFYSKSRYCLVPYYSKADGIIPAFHRLIRASELKTVASCTVLQQSSDGPVSYGLFGRSVIASPAACNTEISILRSPNTVTELLSSVVYDGSGVNIASISSFPLEYTIDECEVHLILKADTPMVCRSLVFYLCCAVPECDICGIY